MIVMTDVAPTEHALQLGPVETERDGNSGEHDDQRLDDEAPGPGSR
jgi:hypothetical protein